MALVHGQDVQFNVRGARSHRCPLGLPRAGEKKEVARVTRLSLSGGKRDCVASWLRRRRNLTLG